VIHSTAEPPWILTLCRTNLSDALVGSGENRKVYESARSQKEEAERIERLAEEFTARGPELDFSTYGGTAHIFCPLFLQGGQH